MGRIDIDRLIGRIDLDAVVKRIDVDEIVRRVDIDKIVEETELGTIVSRSASGFASDAVDAARNQTADVDSLVSRTVNRMLRRSAESVPSGPPLLVADAEPDDADAVDGLEQRSPSDPTDASG